MKFKTYYITVAFAFLFLINGYAQQYDLGVYSMEILEVLNKKSISSTGQIIFPHKNKKYVGIKVTFTPKSKKNDGQNFSSLILKYKLEEYPLKLANGFSFSGGGTGHNVKLRKAKKKSLYAEVPKNFKEGELYYNGKKLGILKVTKGSKKGSFKEFKD